MLTGMILIKEILYASFTPSKIEILHIFSLYCSDAEKWLSCFNV